MYKLKKLFNPEFFHLSVSKENSIEGWYYS